ncbi:Smr/MutS family protein [Cognatiyoonia sp. IB215446]|uniref:Smr/MutS family protein n=1 Tax=Cognatiyoonia sp. IB215446 TaxID=3097355 RepID=UPI002A15E131|nr:Smr/MutS family protein [Cognatiyoonia sp. IB215446]MDX8349197.1 Smr/MutS family protein [Cognatiyoonia sp. IB215446]
MRRPRNLSAEERALWDRVAERTTPMNGRRADPLPEPPKKDMPAPRKEPIPTFRVGEAVNGRERRDVLPGIADRMAEAPVNMDRKSFGKLKRGKLKPEARLDLHGMTLAEAHPALISFIMGSQQMGRRLVLVITGKGKDRDDGGPIPTRLGVLRHQVPQWLALPPLSKAVLQVTPAHLKHGGHGAYYIYLRRQR